MVHLLNQLTLYLCRSDSTFNPMGMEHVYMIANFFIDLIQREHFLPPSLNISIMDKAARQGEKPTQQLFIDHWQVRLDNFNCDTSVEQSVNPWSTVKQNDYIMLVDDS